MTSLRCDEQAFELVERARVERAYQAGGVMSMYPGEEPYTPEQARFERAERAAEWDESERARKLYHACSVLQRMLVPDALVVWEEDHGEFFLVVVAIDKPRIEVRHEGGLYVAQAYGHASILHDFVDPDPAELARQIKVWLAQWQGEFLSAAAADSNNGR